MQKHIKMSFTMVLAFAIILSMATGVLATEQEHVHNWQCAWSDDYRHCMVCSGCQEQKTETHSKDSAGVCTICGHTPHEHIWQYTQGENYDYNHGLHCTQCAATSMEDHIYGNDGKCTVCGNSRPHEHQWEWDGNKSNNLHYHITVCSCGATSTENHLLTWNGTMGDDRGHRMICSVCGFGSFVFDHTYNPAYFNGERCSICGYPGTTVPQPKPSETTPVGTRPVETKPNETTPVETGPVEPKPSETAPVETGPVESKPSETTPVETGPAENKPNETAPVETGPAEIEPEETMPQNAAKEDLLRSSSVWIWVATILVAGGLGTVVFFVKKKSS